MKNTFKFWGIIPLAAALIFALISCSGGGGGSDDPPPQIPAEYQNKTWTHSSGITVELTDTSAVVTPAGGTSTTYAFVSVETVNGNTVLRFGSVNNQEQFITINNGVVIGVSFANIGIKSGGWTASSVVWTVVADSTFGNYSIRAIAWGNGKFVAGGETGKMAYSSDGIT